MKIKGRDGKVVNMVKVPELTDEQKAEQKSYAEKQKESEKVTAVWDYISASAVLKRITAELEDIRQLIDTLLIAYKDSKPELVGKYRFQEFDKYRQELLNLALSDRSSPKLYKTDNDVPSHISTIQAKMEEHYIAYRRGAYNALRSKKTLVDAYNLTEDDVEKYYDEWIRNPSQKSV